MAGLVLWYNTFGDSLEEWQKNDIHFIPGPHHSYRIHNYSTRISNISVSEEDMTKLTVKRNFDYFKNFYPDLNTADQISKHLVKIKRVFL